ncbi:outer membrane lipoprotein-sorting protein [Yokenella regensburgei]|jgi:outer membrane lipoprotein-sorting protein|uniref:Outer membrane lipoprotein-sorting protein n=1 Tax=Yokenella regensburgei TaxID=158877 RepID=A0ABX9RSU4_9ENTR|nr:outer membrane lipoprotein carrier protein LolA [Yokenella regensburgei]EHM48777.1 outer membrane lipoprotein carrier protein LolA [Yokenella regensburgei ATCC 43003]KAF1368951.1 outer membrane lipoprotein-sorting protein [Yokenella regensburgei]MDQ4431050.1 outer membrane lipoprotein carrier protein LolA [Yokenella regensburgei]MDR2218664.1 outer membrane lipoprotein carrier protein LolA [Yokenella regensburgei]QIU91908.1 outer membrane lipoprotein carrier protein LolA [Yokenella regensbur
MKFWPVVLLLLSPFVSAVTLDELQQRFTEQPVVRAHFDQTRTIKDLPQPLRSQGEMLIARDTGLLWDQKTPFPMLLMLDDKRMVQVINHQPAQVITAENNPQMFQFNHLLRALFQADRKVLEQNFRIDFQDKGQGRWTLRLTPTTTPLDKIFATIDLAGQTYLESIQLNDKQGDRTDIALSQHQLTPATLTHDERQRFAAQ